MWRAVKLNKSGFRPPLCTYRLNWARRTFWRWWDDWDDTVLQTQDSKFEPWRSEAEHATSRSRRFPTILTFSRGWGRNIFWKAAVLTTTLSWHFSYKIGLIIPDCGHWTKLPASTISLWFKPLQQPIYVDYPPPPLPHQMLNLCCFNIGPPSATLTQP